MRLGGVMIKELIDGSMTGKVVNPVCRTANMMLRSSEIEQKHGDGKPVAMS